MCQAPSTMTEETLKSSYIMVQNSRSKRNLVGTKKPSHQKRGEKGDHSKEAETQQRNGHQKSVWRTSLVVQWLGIRLPMQGTQIRSLVREDPTCRGATKPVRHNY
ncbi:hypothetical protein J1605_000655 [Eschrichtius robustus]|uniref:Uncharacterized protein n=1 Tax=Eschrichtius robustus TaxID=9764 RepID=A0AB34GN56_ESCRO|nr:hypothetical protein J1605_000655 [Eschrichtius robustus]